MDTAGQMKRLRLGAVALAAVLCAVPLHAAEPEDAMGLERGKYGDPNALVTIGFAFARPDLSELSRGMLDDFASQMDAGAQYEIGGHTDSVGDAAYNQWLSEQRAESVKKYLVNQGVNAEQLTVVGYGETQPADTNRTRLGRAHNRRVVLSPKR
jgi:outer membrane protein OmpA-like peptidoglycan-associated protein